MRGFALVLIVLFFAFAVALSDHPKPANGYHLKTGQREIPAARLTDTQNAVIA
jgi:hypothetical protein